MPAQSQAGGKWALALGPGAASRRQNGSPGSGRSRADGGYFGGVRSQRGVGVPPGAELQTPDLPVVTLGCLPACHAVSEQLLAGLQLHSSWAEERVAPAHPGSPKPEG